MSVYDHRDRPAYMNDGAEPHYCKNPHILQWWTPSHDEVLAKQIEEEQWVWYWDITDKIVAVTEPDIIEIWKLVDPLCSKYAWYNVLMYFAIARADKVGLAKAIRQPQWKVCPLCNHRFVEDSLPYPLIRRLGIEQLDFCAPCLRDTVLQNTGDETLPREAVLSYIRDLADVIERVPPQGFGEGIGDLWDLATEERLAILQVLWRKPSIGRVKELFGSWLKALIEAGVLEDGTRRTSRGTQCLAKDGHVCLSLGEKTIDDFLSSRGIAHGREPPYPEGELRADFLVDGVLVEYFGLKGDPDYDTKTKRKQRICRKHGIRLISVYPSDLVSTRKLEAKLLRGFALESAGARSQRQLQRRDREHSETLGDGWTGDSELVIAGSGSHEEKAREAMRDGNAE